MKGSAKLFIIKAILEEDSLFSMADIMRNTGTSRQLVDHHLGRFTDLAYLSRIKDVNTPNVRFIVVDKESLIREAALSMDDTSKALAKDTLLWKSAEKLNRVTKLVKQAQAIGTGDHSEFEAAIIKEINETIRVMRNAKKNLQDSRYGRKTSIKAILGPKQEEGFNWIETYIDWRKEFGLTSSRTELEKIIRMIEDEITNG